MRERGAQEKDAHGTGGKRDARYAHAAARSVYAENGHDVNADGDPATAKAPGDIRRKGQARRPERAAQRCRYGAGDKRADGCVEARNNREREMVRERENEKIGGRRMDRQRHILATVTIIIDYRQSSLSDSSSEWDITWSPPERERQGM